MLPNPKSKTYAEELDVYATGRQESLTNYPVRAVRTLDEYPTQKEKEELVVPLRGDTKDAAVSRRHSRHRKMLKVRT